MNDSVSTETTSLQVARIIAQVSASSKIDAINHTKSLLLDQLDRSSGAAISRDWVYRNGKSLIFTKKLGSKMVRFSESGLRGAKITVANFQAAPFQWSC